MSLKEQMQTGKLYVEYGHSDPADQAYEREIEAQRIRAKDLCFDYNNTRPSDETRRDQLLTELLGSRGKSCWMESDIHFAYGCNTYIGDHFYANFNPSFVDDGEIHIGEYVMFGPNVTLTTTGHPAWPGYRKTDFAQFSLPIVIKDGAWIGANVVICPGVTIGENSIIGAGSVVTRDIPDNVIAMGQPCRVTREISDRDREYYYRDLKVNEDWKR